MIFLIKDVTAENIDAENINVGRTPTCLWVATSKHTYLRYQETHLSENQEVQLTFCIQCN